MKRPPTLAADPDPKPTRRGAFRLGLCAAVLLAGCDDAPADSMPDPLPLTAGPAADDIPDAPPNPDGLQLAPGFAPLAFDLANTGWLVTAVDGVPTADLQDDLATVHFGRSYLRWAGCDQMEALYIPLTGSFALGRQERKTSDCAQSEVDDALASVLADTPLIGRNREGKVMLAGRTHAVTLSRIDSGPRDPAAPPLDAAPFEIMTGDANGARPILSLHDGRFAVWMDCPAAITGSLRLMDGRLRTGNVQVKDCETYRAAARDELAAFFRASPAIARGHDGELMMSDGETVIGARQCNANPAQCRRTAAAIDVPKDGAEDGAEEETEDAPADRADASQAFIPSR
ncbi:hypothetical protein [Croceicoccus marinus]|jgi:hypothetical protein|uniref:META domain-containing protein n=1 Tax=Croceicoccus marinus TaxID=450378 RepID=A0A7G6VWG1_9SPHN|nr:hypothetical protein [Croceicoccus marinus]QNE06076.1 hypothetical protein H4O24_05430 [Croceicoccus marinus]